MKPTLVFSFIIILLLPFFNSCVGDNESIVSEFIDFGENGLRKNHQYELFLDSIALSRIKGKKAEAKLMVRYSSKCRIKNLLVDMEVLPLNDNDRPVQLKIPLFDDMGNPLGRGNAGLYLLGYPLNISFEEMDSCSFFFSSPLADTQGIESLGIVIKNE